MVDEGLSLAVEVTGGCPKCGSQAYQVESPCPLCGYVGGMIPPTAGPADGREREVTAVDESAKRIREGIARAQAQGKHVGRPPTPFNRAKAVALRKKGYAIKFIARQLKVSRAKVERELAKAGLGDGKPAKPAVTLTGVDLRALKVKIQQEIAALQQKLEAIEAVERIL